MLGFFLSGLIILINVVDVHHYLANLTNVKTTNEQNAGSGS